MVSNKNKVLYWANGDIFDILFYSFHLSLYVAVAFILDSTWLRMNKLYPFVFIERTLENTDMEEKTLQERIDVS